MTASLNDTTSPSPEHNYSPRHSRRALRELLLARLTNGATSLEALAEEGGLTLSELASWATEPRHLEQLVALATLAEINTQLMLSRCRAHAIAGLVRMVDRNELDETSRKACADLLNSDLKLFARPIDTSAMKPDQSLRGPSEEAILNTIAQIAAREGVPA